MLAAYAHGLTVIVLCDLGAKSMHLLKLGLSEILTEALGLTRVVWWSTVAVLGRLASMLLRRVLLTV